MCWYRGWILEFYEVVRNLDVNLTASNGHRIVSLKNSDTNTTINDNDSLSIVGCARPFDLDAQTTLCSYNLFTGVSDIKNTSGDNYGISDFFMDEILDNGLANISNRKNINDISNTNIWPKSNFYQPLQGAK